MGFLNNRILRFLGIILIFKINTLYAQPAICKDPPKMTSTCAEACIICDINGFTGINDSRVQGIAPPDFCTTVVHNIQWIGFIAGTDNLNIEVSVTNCRTGAGLEIGLYKSLDCKTFEQVSNCNTDVRGNTKATFKNTKPLTVGQYYYLVIDGNQGDICNYTVKVLEGSTKVSPLSTSGSIIGDSSVCEGGKYKFYNPGVEGATIYDWTLNGTALGKGDSMYVDFKQSGVYQLCVTASNACDQAAPVCKTVIVKERKRSSVNKFLCTGQCVTVGDSTFCKPGTYDVYFKGSNGCDSIVSVNVQQVQSVESTAEYTVCETDTFRMSGYSFTTAGVHKVKLKTVYDCDSIITLTLNHIVCKINSTVTTIEPKCTGQKNGSATFSVIKGTPPFTYKWLKVQDTLLVGNGNVTALNTPATIPNLAKGDYLITVADNYGNFDIIQATVTEPLPLSIKGSVSDFSGFSVPCAGDKKAAITATASGGVPTYSYKWSTGSTSATVQNIGAGTYTVTATDKNGCLKDTTYKLTEPPVLAADISFSDPNCTGIETGVIALKSLSGGVLPYEYTINGKKYTSISTIDKLPPGIYDVTIKDANNCQYSAKDTLVAPEIPVFDLGDDITIKLGNKTSITISSSVFLAKILWSNQPGLSCYDCKNPDAFPYNNTTYSVVVTSKDGCSTSDSLTIFVDKDRKIFVPNAFSPNNDKLNDRVVIFGNQSVSKIKSFRIYDRWGELIYNQIDFQPNNQEHGWDGTIYNKTADLGVYVWVAEVEFLDGAVLPYYGDITLMR